MNLLHEHLCPHTQPLKSEVRSGCNLLNVQLRRIEVIKVIEGVMRDGGKMEEMGSNSHRGKRGKWGERAGERGQRETIKHS